MTVLVLNGPNLGRLGRRQPEIYGTTTHDELAGLCSGWGRELGLEVETRQTNHEGVLVDWLSYSQVMAAADLVVCHGGHGTLARALSLGKPLLISPAIGDMAENAERVAWAGAGLTVPGRLRGPATIRWAVRTLLEDDRYRRAAQRVRGSQWARGGAERAAEAVEAAL